MEETDPVAATRLVAQGLAQWLRVHAADAEAALPSRAVDDAWRAREGEDYDSACLDLGTEGQRLRRTARALEQDRLPLLGDLPLLFALDGVLAVPDGSSWMPLPYAKLIGDDPVAPQSDWNAAASAISWDFNPWG